MAAFSAASLSLQALASSSRDESDTPGITETERPAFRDEEVLHFAMERLYRDGLRQPPFKVCSSPSGLSVQKNRIANNINPDPATGHEVWTNSGQG